MEEVTLRSRTSLIEIVFYTTAGMALAWWLIYEVSRNSLVAIIPALIGVSLFLAWRSEQGQRQLGIDHYGLTIRTTLLDVNVVPWSEIEAIAVADVGSFHGGVYSYRGQFLGIRLASSSALKTSKQCSDNRHLSEYDILLSDKYGMPLKEFEAFLSEAKRHAQGR